ncbi:MAG: energy transducer TonB [Colwellia sp.]|nr:energy transducer TonB [Colwellia sp.]
MSKLLLALVIVAVHLFIVLLATSAPIEKEQPTNFDAITVNLLVNHDLKKRQAGIVIKQDNAINSKVQKLITNKSNPLISSTASAEIQANDLATTPLSANKKSQDTNSTSTINSHKQTTQTLFAIQQNAQPKTKISNVLHPIAEKTHSKPVTPQRTSNVPRNNQQVARYLYNPAPVYPRFARKRGWQGKVQLNLLISRVGEVSKIKLLKSSGYKLLDNSAITTLQQWRFVPTQLNTGAIDYWYMQNINFQLDKKTITTPKIQRQARNNT